MSDTPEQSTDDTPAEVSTTEMQVQVCPKCGANSTGTECKFCGAQFVPTESTSKPVSFAEAAEEQQPSLLVEFGEFLMESKKWWLIPILVVLLLVGVLVFLSSSVVAPFIYPIF